MPTFYVPESLAGQTLQNIREQQNLPFRADILAGFGGITENTPLTTGLPFNLRQDPGSAEFQQAQRLFTGSPSAGITGGGITGGGLVGGGGNDLVEQAKRILQFTSEANKPVVSSLEAQRQPLIDRYQSLLSQIKGSQQIAEQRQSTATSREFGRRGIPLSSGLFEQSLADVLNPITQQYTELAKQTGAGREADLLSLAREIAQLQAGQPGQAFGQALQLGGFEQQAQSLAQQFAAQQFQQQLGERQFGLQEREFGLKEKQFNQDPYGLFS